jgi:hypothetical protein
MNAVFFGIYGYVCDYLVEIRIRREIDEFKRLEYGEHKYRNAYFKFRGVSSSSLSPWVRNSSIRIFLQEQMNPSESNQVFVCFPV